MNSFISEIFEDSHDNLWFGTYTGLTVFNRDTKESIIYANNPKDSTSLSSNTVNAVFEDSKKRLWVATSGGLNLFDRKNETFISYTTKDGLPTDAVYGILEADNNEIWLSTPNGLSCFNPEKVIFKNYNVSDGLQGNYFNENSFLKTKSGELLFGGINGFNIINPANIRTNEFEPSILITDFRIFNTPVIPGQPGSPLKKPISETEEIELNYLQSVFSFDFVALNYRSQEKNQYAYRLAGLENNWNYIGDKRSATYTNLDPGKYLFQVKGSNNDGVWNEKGRSLSIIVLPPWWKTWWFRGIAGTLIIFSFVEFFMARINIIKNQKKELEVLVSQRTAEVVAQKEELSMQHESILKQKGHIDLLYSDLKDSIRAAQNIQASILPSKEKIQAVLPESFILYLPKDVVIGDFYWFDVINNKIIISAADCTGHGVSGAFMSINGHHLLNLAIHLDEKLIASEILDRLNKNLIKELHFSKDNEWIRGGIDIALCIIDEDKKSLQYAGANNPLYILRGTELIQIKADKFGLNLNEKEKRYTNHIIPLQPDDSIYLFSDGYPDQIGGDDGNEKFMYHRFRELLQAISFEPMDKQRILLEENLNDWKKDTPQLDDIIVIGFKV